MLRLGPEWQAARRERGTWDARRRIPRLYGQRCHIAQAQCVRFIDPQEGGGRSGRYLYMQHPQDSAELCSEVYRAGCMRIFLLGKRNMAPTAPLVGPFRLTPTPSLSAPQVDRECHAFTPNVARPQVFLPAMPYRGQVQRHTGPRPAWPSHTIFRL